MKGRILLFTSTLAVFIMILAGSLFEIFTSKTSMPLDENAFEIGGEQAKGICAKIADQVWGSTNGAFQEKSYDPSWLAWSVHYEILAYRNLYNATSDKNWLERMMTRCDYLVKMSDVNGDGIPSWGNYNETYGTARWGYWGEESVEDGLAIYALLETAQLIYSNPTLASDSGLKARADGYVDIAERVVRRWHSFWTQVSKDEGYYWRFAEKETNDVIVNYFTIMAAAELKLYDIKGDPIYLERPIWAGNYLKNRLIYHPELEAYTWHYSMKGQWKDLVEDISHASIDLYLIMGLNAHSLVFNKTDMIRFSNTYTKLIWKGDIDNPRLAMRIDGTGPSDYAKWSNILVRLSTYNPNIWLYQWLIFNDYVKKIGLDISDATVLQGLTELLTYYNVVKNSFAELRESVIRERKKEAEDKVNSILLTFEPYRYFAYREYEEGLKAIDTDPQSAYRHFVYACEISQRAVALSLVTDIIIASFVTLIVMKIKTRGVKVLKE